LVSGPVANRCSPSRCRSFPESSMLTLSCRDFALRAIAAGAVVPARAGVPVVPKKAPAKIGGRDAANHYRHHGIRPV
jgi:hypothetical protein